MCKCCIGPYENQSCGWPKGTVRAVIALSVIFLGVMSLATLMILLYASEKFEAAIGVGSTIGGLVGIVIGYYFGSRGAEGAAEGAAHMIVNTENQLLKTQEAMSRNMSRPIRKKRKKNGNPVDDELLIVDDEDIVMEL